MSEYEQVLACFLTARRWFDSAHESNWPLALRRLWVDVTTTEPKQAQDGRRQAGCIRALDEICDSSTGHTTYATLCPPVPWTGANAKPMYLQDVGSTPTSLVLHLKIYYLQVHLPSHVLCQALTREQWETNVAQVSQENRAFFVQFALDFGEGGLLVFMAPFGRRCIKVDWFTAIEDMPFRCADVYTDYTTFLQGVASWICHRYYASPDTAPDGLAVSAIQEAQSVFGGMGPYTVNEVFFIAGLSPFLTEQEIFKCPSRTARLCEAFWTFAYNAHSNVPALLTKCYNDLLLAPNIKQRLKFCRRLRVYGQREVATSLRAAALAQRYETRVQSVPTDRPFMRNAIGGLFDVFEPTYLQPALRKRGSSHNLSHLVFGPIEWRLHGGPLPKAPDPLTLTFRELGHPPDGPTNLDLSRYRSQRFLSPDEMTKAKVSCHLYQGRGSTVPIWSITPQIPLNHEDGQATTRRWQEIRPVHEIDQCLGQYIIEQTDGRFVGPLEHCGMGPFARQNITAPTSPPDLTTPARYVERNLALDTSRKASASKRKAPRPSLDFHIVRTPTTQAAAEPEPESPAKRRKVSTADFGSPEYASSEARRLGLLDEDVFGTVAQTTQVQQIAAKSDGENLWMTLRIPK